MDAPTGVSKSTRGLSSSDVMFLVSVAFVFFALVTLVFIRH